jgi:hypothetical protein
LLTARIIVAIGITPSTATGTTSTATIIAGAGKDGCRL